MADVVDEKDAANSTVKDEAKEDVETPNLRLVRPAGVESGPGPEPEPKPVEAKPVEPVQPKVLVITYDGDRGINVARNDLNWMEATKVLELVHAELTRVQR